MHWKARRGSLQHTCARLPPPTPCTTRASGALCARERARVCHQVGSCRVLCSADVPSYQTLLAEPNTYFYRYAYTPFQREKRGPSFALLPSGLPAAGDGSPDAGTANLTHNEPLAVSLRDLSGVDASRLADSRSHAIRDDASTCGRVCRQAGPTDDASQQPGAAEYVLGKSREERLGGLQAKLDRLWPPFTDVHGVWRREFTASIPLPGERYAGEGCARCEVLGCDRHGMIFHMKNLMTHAAPRGGPPAKMASSRTHGSALIELLGHVPAAPPRAALEESQPPGTTKLQDSEQEEHSAPATIPAQLARRSVTPRNHESRNFSGQDGNFIYYRGMRLSFRRGQVLLVRRQRLGSNPAHNVKFLGSLLGTPSEWHAALQGAQERAKASALILVLARQYSDLHLNQPGGLDSNHCLHLFNHFRPADKKMINKWETYMPVALHRTYERLVRQPLQISPGQLCAMTFQGLFDALPEKDLQSAPQQPAAATRELLVVTRRWKSSVRLGVGDRVVARYCDGREWFTGAVIALCKDGAVDIGYDDGDSEEAVPAERVLSTEHEEGHWQYVVAGPRGAKSEGAGQHPAWPSYEQFVDFVTVHASEAGLDAELAQLSEKAEATYSAASCREKPWPLVGLEQGDGGAALLAKHAEKPRAQLLAEAATHRAKLAADLRQVRAAIVRGQGG